eukprot:TRINITY_DN11784_c0_g1_i2.p1 TRINITY_DN11784_c0_g1~~TRINITY_DN11784_c0_g1_i2.p1  ORF type:complete len:191 (-),score=24.33 TRINITY_DN11784_c0_g1_i2:257-829(-)
MRTSGVFVSLAILLAASVLEASEASSDVFQLIHAQSSECAVWRSDWLPDMISTVQLEAASSCPMVNTSQTRRITSFRNMSDGRIMLDDASGRCLGLENASNPIEYPQPDTGRLVTVEDCSLSAAFLSLHRDADMLKAWYGGHEIGCLKIGGAQQIGDFAYVGPDCDKPANSSNGWRLHASDVRAEMDIVV